jgi:hypothetical protein
MSEIQTLAAWERWLDEESVREGERCALSPDYVRRSLQADSYRRQGFFSGYAAALNDAQRMREAINTAIHLLREDYELNVHEVDKVLEAALAPKEGA